MCLETDLFEGDYDCIEFEMKCVTDVFVSLVHLRAKKCWITP